MHLRKDIELRLILNVTSKIVVDDIVNFFLLPFRENKNWYFMWIESYEMPRLIFFENKNA